MRRLDKINVIDIKKGCILLNDESIQIGDTIANWIESFKSAKFTIDNSFSNFSIYKFSNAEGILVYTNKNNQIVFQFSILLFPNVDCFKGKLSIEGQTVVSPLYAKDIKLVFPDLDLKKLPSIYDDNYDTNAFNFFPCTDSVQYDVKINRDKKHIGLISLVAV